MLADPAQSGLLCERFFQYRRTVGEGAVAERPNALFNTPGELLQPFAQHLVVITAQCIARQVGL